MLDIGDIRKIDNMIKENKEYFSFDKWGISDNINQDFVLSNLMKIYNELNLMVTKNFRAEAELILSKNIDLFIKLLSECEYFLTTEI